MPFRVPCTQGGAASCPGLSHLGPFRAGHCRVSRIPSPATSARRRPKPINDIVDLIVGEAGIDADEERAVHHRVGVRQIADDAAGDVAVGRVANQDCRRTDCGSRSSPASRNAVISLRVKPASSRTVMTKPKYDGSLSAGVSGKIRRSA